MKKLRISFCFPGGMDIENTPAIRCFNKLTPIDGWEISKKVAIGSGIGRNRNSTARCVQEFCGSETDLKWQHVKEYDKILFIDYDVEYTTDDVRRILEHNEDIVSGLYQLKNDVNGKLSETCHAGLWNLEKGIVNHRYKWVDQGVKQVNWVGAGFLCIKASTLEKMPYPWFRHTIIEVEKQGYTMSKECGEDIGFSLLAAECGFKIYVDCDIKLNHKFYINR